MRPSPDEVAILLIAMVRRVGGKRGEGSRWRISIKTLRKVSSRAMIREAFLDELEEELAELGYTLLRLMAGGYGLIETSAFDSWPSVSTRDRLEKEMKALKAGDRTSFDTLIQAARTEFAPANQTDDDE
jgi:hypothetical protein